MPFKDKAAWIQDLMRSQALHPEAFDTMKTSSPKCVLCGGDASVFKDSLSEKEYSISGLCQQCQDEVWSEPCED